MRRCFPWMNVPESRRKRVVKSLQERSLVEFQGGEFWLHPVIRSEAIERLRRSENWETANREAATFWTEKVKQIVTIRDALTALEAYYHFIEIGDLTKACVILLKIRTNKWNQSLWLGSTLYRMGILQPLYFALSQTIDHVKHEPCLSDLYSLLGDFFWIAGNVVMAIDCQEKSKSLNESYINRLQGTDFSAKSIFDRKMRTVDALISQGIYQIDLWELERFFWVLGDKQNL